MSEAEKDSASASCSRAETRRKVDRIIVGKEGIYKHLITNAIKVFKIEYGNADTASLKNDLARFIHILIETFKLKYQHELTEEDAKERSIEFLLLNNGINDAEQLRQLYDTHKYHFSSETLLELVVNDGAGPRHITKNGRKITITIADRIISLFKADLVPNDCDVIHRFLIDNLAPHLKIEVLQALLKNCDTFKDCGKLLTIHVNEIIEEIEPKQVVFKANNNKFKELLKFLKELFEDKEEETLFANKFHDIKGKVKDMIQCFDYFKTQDTTSLTAMEAYLVKNWSLDANGKVPNRGENDDGESESGSSEKDENYIPSDQEEDNDSSNDSADSEYTSNNATNSKSTKPAASNKKGTSNKKPNASKSAENNKEPNNRTSIKPAAKNMKRTRTRESDHEDSEDSSESSDNDAESKGSSESSDNDEESDGISESSYTPKKNARHGSEK